MHHLIRASALLFALALLAWQSPQVDAEPKEGDWKSGWNTWAKAVEGDWAEYAMDGGFGIKQEVVKVSGDNVTYLHKTLMKGKETSSRERTRDWKSIKLQGRLPHGRENQVQWKDAEVELDGETLTCTVASWAIGEASTEIWYSKQVPCGGIVKTVTNGKDSVWLTKFKSSMKDDNGDEDKAVESELPSFYATKGNYAVYQVTDRGRNSFVRHEITAVEKESSTWTSVKCNKAGDPELGEEPEEHKLTKKDWDAKYTEPKSTGQELETEAGDFECDVFEHTDDEGVKTTEYVVDGLVVMKVVKGERGSETWLLVKHEMK